jgi:hypothetical protein
LDPRQSTILILTGVYNLMRRALEVYSNMLKSSRSLQLLFVCGKDKCRR